MKRGMKGRASALMISSVSVRPVVLCGRFLKAQTNSWWRIIRRRRRRAGQKARVYLRRSSFFFSPLISIFPSRVLLVYHAAAAALIRLRRGSSSSTPRCQVKLNRYFFWQGEQKVRRDLFFSFEGDSPHLTKHNR